MRMPNARQISEEQQDIFEDAPIDGSILVSGPPGTGKTVIAFLRAQILANKNRDVTVLMYNRVLRRYTENVAAEINGNVQSKTMHTWFPEWWRSHRITTGHSSETLIIDGDRAFVNCPYEDKDKLKKVGGKWGVNKFNPFTNKKGMWYVPKSRYDSDPSIYSAWTGTSYEPLELARWQYNWLAMRDLYLDQPQEKMVDWGHLIIDEAQDFEPGLFSFLHLTSKQLEHGALTILADENQRLEENRHSSLEDIRTTLKLNKKPEREFSLTINFRNTYQIAKVASHFYVGLPTGVPKLPNRQGNKPQLVVVSNVEQQIQYICRSLKNRAALEVGVIVDNDTDRELFVKEIADRLINYTVQSYSSKNYKSSEDLVFDTQGVVTVLHRKSCKGLEFDAVFIPQLQSFTVDDTDLTTFKMNLYVMCSRAREELVFLCNDGTRANPAFFEHFPNRASGLIDYREQE
ncbi:AAA family ATPase [Vibrio alginolyticus]|uniref:AAA family ATPase n=1 Tax=Vibrio TaxID=662 RepID=UPI001EFC6B48|nr:MULTISPECIES: AAA family ATPase [Vibrio]MCG9718531.1 AAA family ATPase [Vibrio alginolyticus]MDW1872656.1 AAA family ATPase [Vibrio sp. Vb0598]